MNPLIPKINTPISTPTPDAMYNQASTNTQQKYGYTVPPYFLKSVQQQESSNIVNPNDYGRSFGLVNADGTNGAKTSLGKDYLPDTSLTNSTQNAANYLASRATLHNNDGSVRKNLIQSNQLGELYVQRYVGVMPGGFRNIPDKNGKIQKVPYQSILDSFNKKLVANQPAGQSLIPKPK